MPSDLDFSVSYVKVLDDMRTVLRKNIQNHIDQFIDEECPESALRQIRTALDNTLYDAVNSLIEYIEKNHDTSKLKQTTLDDIAIRVVHGVLKPVLQKAFFEAINNTTGSSSFDF